MMTTTVDEYRALVRDLPVSSGPATVSIADAVGAVCDEDVCAVAPQPRFDTAAMDGFACRAADLHAGARVRVTAVSLAAPHPDLVSVGAVCAVQVMTGAPVPVGADVVVPVECTSGFVEAIGAEIVIHEVPKRANIRRAGSDLAAGATVVPQGTVLRPSAIGVMATIGRSTVRIRSTVTVTVVSTGTELVSTGTEPGHGQIVESNSAMIAADLRSIPGVRVFRAPIVADDREVFLAAMHEHAARSDLIVTTGGVGAGTADVVRSTLGVHGITFRRVAMKPGRPQGSGLFADTPTICLPGSPGAALVSYELFVRPCVTAAVRRPDLNRQEVAASYSGPSVPPQAGVVRVGLGCRGADGVVRAETGRPTPAQMAVADCWFLVDGNGLRDGDEVVAVLF